MKIVVIIILYEMFLLVYFQCSLELFVFACLLILGGLKVKNYLKNILIIEYIKNGYRAIKNKSLK